MPGRRLLKLRRSRYPLTHGQDVHFYSRVGPRQLRLAGLRCEHFPPELNLLQAQLTLFHRLSSAQTARLDVLELPAAPVFVL
jgi:hypothetical protein